MIQKSYTWNETEPNVLGHDDCLPNVYGRGFDPRLHEIVFEVILVPQNNVKYYVET